MTFSDSSLLPVTAQFRTSRCRTLRIKRELEATIRETQAELVGVKAQVLGTPIQNHPFVEKAKSQVRQAFLNFHRRNVVAPLSGYIAKRQVQIGDTVKAGSPLLAIVPG